MLAENLWQGFQQGLAVFHFTLSRFKWQPSGHTDLTAI